MPPYMHVVEWNGTANESTSSLLQIHYIFFFYRLVIRESWNGMVKKYTSNYHKKTICNEIDMRSI